MAVLASDSFNRADETPIGGNWTLDQANVANLSGNVQVWVFASGASDVTNARWNALTWPNDQWSQATQVALGGSGNNGVAVRIQTSGRGAYHFAPRTAGNGGYLLERLNTDTSKTTVASNAGIGGVAGDVVYMQVIGSSFDCRQNGVSRMTGTDSTFASGAAGLSGFVSSDGYQTDDWSGGDFVEDPPGLQDDSVLAGHVQASLLLQAALLNDPSGTPVANQPTPVDQLVSSVFDDSLALLEHAQAFAQAAQAAALAESTWSGEANPDIALAAAASVTVTGVADLSVGKPLAASGTVSVTGSAELSVGKPLAASGTVTVTGSVDLTAAPDLSRPLATTSNVTVTGTADLSVGKPIAAASTVAVTGAAELSVGRPLAAAGLVSVTGTADLSVGKPLAASGTVSVTGAVELSNGTDLARPLATTSSVSVTGQAALSVGKPLAASANVSVLATADLSVGKPLAASGTVVVTGVADLTVVKPKQPESAGGHRYPGVHIPGLQHDLPDPRPDGKTTAQDLQDLQATRVLEEARQRQRVAIERDDEDLLAIVTALLAEDLID
jgi:hypothetical protein